MALVGAFIMRFYGGCSLIPFLLFPVYQIYSIHPHIHRASQICSSNSSNVLNISTSDTEWVYQNKQWQEIRVSLQSKVLGLEWLNEPLELCLYSLP